MWTVGWWTFGGWRFGEAWDSVGVVAKRGVYGGEVDQGVWVNVFDLGYQFSESLEGEVLGAYKTRVVECLDMGLIYLDMEGRKPPKVEAPYDSSIPPAGELA